MGRNNPAEAKGKTERQQTILRLIQEHPISRQEVLLEHLRQEGFEVTQATISRDIRELCLVKAATADGYRYVSSHNESLNPKMQGRFETIFHESVLGVDFAGHVVLVKCYSGMANAACEVFDALKWKKNSPLWCGENICWTAGCCSMCGCWARMAGKALPSTMWS